MRGLVRPTSLGPVLLALAGLALPAARQVVQASPDPNADPLDAVAGATVTALPWWHLPQGPPLAVLVLAAGIVAPALRAGGRREWLALLLGMLAGAALPFRLLGLGLLLGTGAWLVVAAAVLFTWRLLVVLSDAGGLLRGVVVPALFGAMLLYGWELLVRGFGVPLILLPPPSLILDTLVAQRPVLADDFVQTILRSALRGYVMGCAAGFALALVCDRFPMLGRGLLPYCNLVSAVPMVGIAPIMIMWFGFGWQSKAAVVVVTTLFPMLVNTLTGLAQSERLQLDLMRSYGAGYRRTLVKLRLPNALPFIFNALKVNSTFALISAIVAEFFGTPISGMGFRISTEVARMNLGMVWATIAIAAVTGSAVYGGLALLERAVTTWHPSYRQR